MRAALTLCCLLAMAAGADDAALSQGALLARGCGGCHAASNQTIPSLQGWDAERLITTLMAYKHDELQGTLMNRLAKGYSEAQLRAIATYLEKTGGQ